MRKRSVMFSAVLLAITAGMLPLLGVSKLLQAQSLRAQEQYVGNAAAWTASRVERTLDDARQALSRAQRIDRTDCSLAHRKMMGQVAADSRSIEDVGFFRNSELVCSRLGSIDPPVPAHPSDLDIGGGNWLSYAERPVLFKGSPRVEIRRGDYGVLITPGRLTDLVADKGTVYGVASRQGRVLESSTQVDPQLVQALLVGGHSPRADQFVFAARPVSGLVAFALVEKGAHEASLLLDWRYTVLIGGVISAMLLGLILCVWRQQPSPEKALKRAIRNRELVVHYQPIMDLTTGRCRGAEALVRWPQPDGRIALPGEFLPLAEAKGLTSALTELVIETALEEMGAFFRAHGELHVSLNIPADDMETACFLPRLSQAVSRAGVDPSQVWLEITEHGFMNASAAAVAIRKVRAAGHRVVIDDFGTGYSSLSLLEGLSLDALKIDKSFVKAIDQEAAQSIVVNHIISMAHQLNLAMVAEGVETEAQARYLMEAGVQYAQGWLYAKALPADAFKAFVQGRQGGTVDG